MLPLGCLPLRGKEGVTFVFFLMNEKMNKIRFSPEPKFPLFINEGKKREKDGMSVKNTLQVICLNSNP